MKYTVKVAIVKKDLLQQVSYSDCRRESFMSRARCWRLEDYYLVEEDDDCTTREVVKSQ